MSNTSKTKSIPRYWWNDDTALFAKEDGELVKYSDHKAIVDAQALEIERLKKHINSIRTPEEVEQLSCDPEDFHNEILNEIDPLGQELK